MKNLIRLSLIWVMIMVFVNILFAQYKIMPVGDSITEGETGSQPPVGGFRDDLNSLLTNEGVNFQYVGSLQDALGLKHEGRSGWTADQIDGSITQWLNTYSPNIVLLHIGTNDITSNQGVQGILGEIESIVEKIHSYNSSTWILICSLIPRTDAKDGLTTNLNSLIQEMFYNKQSLGYRIYYVGQNEVFKANPNWVSEYMYGSTSVHPNNAGYNVMAEVYFNAIMNVVHSTDVKVTDNFNRTALGITWAADPEYQIVNNQLSNTSTVGSWEFLATYKAQTNPTQVSIKWGMNANKQGINEGGLALRLDAPSANANGYLAWILSSGYLALWTIANGQPNQGIAFQAGLLPAPQPGDEFKVAMTSDGTGHQFDYYINDNFAGRLTDSQKLLNPEISYAGVMLKGNLNNDLDDFTLYHTTDKTPPAQVTDLAIETFSSSMVRLRWTAPGDDSTTGIASSYDIRYSTGLITSANFSSATKASGIPIPSAPGTTQSFQITGLLPATMYYFALKTADEVPNWSPLSNVVSTTTLSATSIVDDFNRTELGPDWAADPEFRIVSGELDNTSTEERWDFMAVYKARKNPTEVSFKWGSGADADGTGRGGLALMLDAPSPTANGYLVWIRTDVRKLYMYTIVNGAPSSLVDRESFAESLPDPKAGDVFKVVMNSDVSGHHFDFYLNDQFYGQLTDIGKQQGNAATLYAGVMLHGNLNNNIDDFTVTSPKGKATELVYVWGNNQTGTVNKRLPDSLVVRAIDANSNPVDGVRVNFTIKEGSGTLSMPIDKNIRIEAESGTLTSPMQIASDPNASGGQYIYVPSGSETGMATYTVQISTAGNYRIWGRVIGVDETSNSVYVSIDGGAESRWKFRPPSASWFWNLVCHVRDDGSEERPKIFSLTAGTHTLKIRGRQANSRIDKLIFTTDANFIPSGKEDLQTPVTDQSGQTYAILTLGTTVGRVQVEASSSGLNTISFTAKAVADSAKTLVKTSGDNQTGKGGQPLANPFVVTVYDKYNNPVSMVPVTFTVIKGGGTLSNLQPVYTDTLGRASTVLTLGTEADTNKVQASSPRLQGSPVTFTARATEGIATKLVYVSGNNQTGTVKTPLAAPFKVKVVDSQDKPVVNHKVHFKVTAGGGILDGNTLTEKDVLTGIDGIAQVVLTLGQTSGTNNNKVEASASRAGQPLTGSPITFVASANPDVAQELKLVSGNNQTGAPGMPLAAPFVVKVVDKYNNPITGHSVTFTVTAGDGTLDGSTDKTKTYLTEADGTTQTRLTLGSAPGVINKVQASASRAGNPLTGSPVTFEAVPGVASKIVYVYGNNKTGSAGYPLADSFKVQIQDNYGNPYGGYTVTFTVTEGNGTLDGTSQTTKNVTTNINGIAKVLLTLGPTPGASNKVQASAVKDGQPLTNSPITFKARAVGLSKLSKVSGDSLRGTVGTPLSQPFKVMVQDSLNQAIAGWSVTFTVKSGNGNFGGQSQTTVPTNSGGIAEATLTLGPTPGTYNNVAEASASYSGKSLTGSPITFRASSVLGHPSQLIYISGNGQAPGVVGNPLSEPFKVKVGDAFANAISSHPVTFVVTAGGGTLYGNTEKTINTDSLGMVQVTLTLGPTAGDSNNIVEARSFYNGKPLTHSPIVFKASSRPSAAKNLVYISGNGQTGTAGKPLAEPFKVKVTDKGGVNPVPAHPVKFKIIQGGGNFGGGSVDTVRLTNSQGIAEVTLTLGPKVGIQNNIVEASSTNGPDVLTGSPILFKASANPGKPDANVSTITATTPVPADGSSTSIVTVTLMDAYGNPVSNKVVLINATGFNNIITQPMLPTNLDGQATGYIASTKAEVKTVSARDVTDTLDLNSTAKVRFTHLAAYMINLYSGTGQTGNKGAALKDPIQVKVTDMYTNPVPGFLVNFKVTEGGGMIVGSQTVSTDSSGLASGWWILGTSATIHRAQATAAGLLGSPIEFIATGVDGIPSKLTIDSGNDQTGMAGGTLLQPFVAKVTDSQNRPVWDVSVTFEVTSGGGTFGGNSSLVVNTDVFGCAAAYLTLGKTIGTNTVKATAQGVSGSVTFTATSVAGMAAMINKVSGDQQSATIGTALPEPLVVKVTDINNNAKPGYQVTFEVVQGNATITESQPVTTNNEGKASVRIQLGNTAGQIIVEARATGLMGSPVRFTEKATATSAVAMAIYSGNNQQGTFGRELVYPVAVLVTDGHNNPVENVSITFAVTEGGGSLLKGSLVTTNESGIALNRWVLGPNVGKNELWAIKTGLSGSPITFTATGVTNKFPIISGLKDTTIAEAQSIEFRVDAEDEDKDPVTYGARNLPFGASYDSTGSRKFSWTPSYAQAGSYTIHFMARDNKGGFDDEPVTIKVKNVNRPPQIKYAYPYGADLAAYWSQNDTIQFTISGSDPDGDPLIYMWTNNGALVSMSPTYTLIATHNAVGSHQIIGKIYDGTDWDQRVWSVWVKTPVELVSFTAEVIGYQGVKLSWETSIESNNAGFNVWRSRSLEGNYEKLNASLIPARHTKQYSFTDANVKVGARYFYRLEDVSLDGQTTRHDPIAVEVTRPEQFELSQNYPNPFNPETRINYQLPMPCQVRITIYNLLGQKVKTLIDTYKEAGYHVVYWDSKDEFENPVSSGLYYYRIEAGTFTQTRKMILLK